MFCECYIMWKPYHYCCTYSLYILLLFDSRLEVKQCIWGKVQSKTTISQSQTRTEHSHHTVIHQLTLFMALLLPINFVKYVNNNGIVCFYKQTSTHAECKVEVVQCHVMVCVSEWVYIIVYNNVCVCMLCVHANS